MNRTSLLQFLLLGTIWGASYTFIKVSLDGLTPAQLVLARIVLGLLLLLGFLSVRKIRLPKLGSVWGHVTVAAALGMVVPFLLLAFGERHTSAAMAGVLIAALPLVTLAAATTFLPTERATSRKLAGFLAGFAGVVLIMAPWESEGGTIGGQLAVLGAACSYAAQTVYIRKFIVPYKLAPVALAASQLVMATILQAAVTPTMAWETPNLTWQVVSSIIVLGVFGTGLAYVLYFRLITDLGATTASSVNYLVPVVGMVVSTSLLGESLTWNMIVGVVIVMVGLAVAENRFGRKAVETPAPRAAEPDAGKAADVAAESPAGPAPASTAPAGAAQPTAAQKDADD
jgi:drug/metabolite transporter (DMT)-like permease